MDWITDSGFKAEAAVSKKTSSGFDVKTGNLFLMFFNILIFIFF